MAMTRPPDRQNLGVAMVRSLVAPRVAAVALRSRSGTRFSRGRGLLLVLGAALLLSLLPPSALRAQSVSPEVQVSSYLRWQSEPSVAALGDHLVAAWNNRLFVSG